LLRERMLPVKRRVNLVVGQFAKTLTTKATKVHEGNA